jgi:putative ATP-dependent endonuclease of OLD family
VTIIKRIVVKGYRCFAHLDIEPNAGMNIIVGDNEAGKSTLLEAISLALTGKVNGKWSSDELNPFWFNQAQVHAYFRNYGTSEPAPAPEVLIELYFSDDDDVQQLRGVHNSRREDCPGISFRAFPSPDYDPEFAAYMADSPPTIVPVEFYDVEWRDFADGSLAHRPKNLAVSFIDSRTIRSTSGVDYHTREMLSAHLDAKEKAQLSLAHRTSRQAITDGALKSINDRIAAENATLHDRPMGLQMDQSSRTSWETGVVPQVDNIPFAMAGQGAQATVKMILAMSRSAGSASFILVEEPENHLSYTTLTRLVNRVEQMAGANQQLFITTHSSFVLNRLGLDKLLLLHDSRAAKLTSLGADTINYFRKLPGYDTLRLVLAQKVALVEGPSDQIILERAFKDETGRLPAEAGIDIITMGGLTFKRALEVCSCLDRQAVALQDNDGKSVVEITDQVAHLTKPGHRELLVSEPEKGETLEPQIAAVNDPAVLRSILQVTGRADPTTSMTNNKTEAALRIFDSPIRITFPSYIYEAVARLR